MPLSAMRLPLLNERIQELAGCLPAECRCRPVSVGRDGTVKVDPEPVVACDQRSTDDRADSLRAAALGLVPPGSKVVATEDGACIQVAAFPSCVTTYFRAPTVNLAERVAAVRAEARKQGWEEQLVRNGSDDGSGGAFLRLHRRQLDANVVLVRSPAPQGCADEPPPNCVDSVRVILPHG